MCMFRIIIAKKLISCRVVEHTNNILDLLRIHLHQTVHALLFFTNFKETFIYLWFSFLSG